MSAERKIERATDKARSKLSERTLGRQDDGYSIKLHHAAEHLFETGLRLTYNLLAGVARTSRQNDRAIGRALKVDNVYLAIQFATLCLSRVAPLDPPVLEGDPVDPDDFEAAADVTRRAFPPDRLDPRGAVDSSIAHVLEESPDLIGFALDSLRSVLAYDILARATDGVIAETSVPFMTDLGGSDFEDLFCKTWRLAEGLWVINLSRGRDAIRSDWIPPAKFDTPDEPFPADDDEDWLEVVPPSTARTDGARYCPQCGRRGDESDRFCRGCGTSLDAN